MKNIEKGFIFLLFVIFLLLGSTKLLFVGSVDAAGTSGSYPGGRPVPSYDIPPEPSFVDSVDVVRPSESYPGRRPVPSSYDVSPDS